MSSVADMVTELLKKLDEGKREIERLKRENERLTCENKEQRGDIESYLASMEWMVEHPVPSDVKPGTCGYQEKYAGASAKAVHVATKAEQTKLACSGGGKEVDTDDPGDEVETILNAILIEGNPNWVSSCQLILDADLNGLKKVRASDWEAIFTNAYNYLSFTNQGDIKKADTSLNKLKKVLGMD